MNLGEYSWFRGHDPRSGAFLIRGGVDFAAAHANGAHKSEDHRVR